jgi:hypothetical protein
MNKIRTVLFYFLVRLGLKRENYYDSEKEIWEKYYPRGNTILDVGSFNDSPFWFLEHGAKRVIAIDQRWFNFEDERVNFIKAKIDGIKIDIEGAEKNMIIETHYQDPKLELVHDFNNGVKLWRLS